MHDLKDYTREEVRGVAPNGAAALVLTQRLLRYHCVYAPPSTTFD